MNLDVICVKTSSPTFDMSLRIQTVVMTFAYGCTHSVTLGMDAKRFSTPAHDLNNYLFLCGTHTDFVDHL